MVEKGRSTRTNPELAPEPKAKLLCLDGAGVYGLITAIWLRKLAEQEPTFLANTRPVSFESWPECNVIAGASSGAVNALLLAKEENPREAVLAGTLERFWKRPGMFSNTDPWSAWWSLFGYTPWFGTDDLLAELHAVFGDLRMGELKQSVVVTTFNWGGGLPGKPIEFSRPDESNPWGAWGFGHFAAQSQKTGWRPRAFTNFLLDEKDRGDLDYKVADIAYAVCAAPGFRGMRGGLGDAATFTVNPSMDIICAMIYFARLHARGLLREEKAERRSKVAAGDLSQLHQMGAEFDVYANALMHLSMLSIGDGNIVPRFWLPNSNLGFTQTQTYPTDPATQNYYPTSAWLSLEGPTSHIDDCASTLLGSPRFLRLDPAIMQIPTLTASWLARFPGWREYLFHHMYSSAETPLSHAAIAEAAKFTGNNWTGQRQPPQGFER